MLLHYIFGFLDPLGYFHFLLTRQKRHLTHLFEIHPDRIIENIQLRLGFFFLLLVEIFFYFFMSIDVGCLDDVDFHPAEPGKNGVQLVRICYSIWKRLVQVIEREITLLLGQFD